MLELLSPKKLKSKIKDENQKATDRSIAISRLSKKQEIEYNKFSKDIKTLIKQETKEFSLFVSEHNKIRKALKNEIKVLETIRLKALKPIEEELTLLEEKQAVIAEKQAVIGKLQVTIDKDLAEIDKTSKELIALEDKLTIKEELLNISSNEVLDQIASHKKRVEDFNVEEFEYIKIHHDRIIELDNKQNAINISIGQLNSDKQWIKDNKLEIEKSNKKLDSNRKSLNVALQELRRKE